MGSTAKMTVFDVNKISTALSKLKCDICKNHLSFFPILLSTNGENICGRCSPTCEEVPTTRVLIYETLAESLYFPCRYKADGCLIEEVPKEITKHEEICPFRVVPCPIPSCTWEGSYPIVPLHCKDTHNEYILQENTEFAVPQDEDQRNLIITDQKIIVLKSEYYSDKNQFKFSIYYPSYELETTEITCQIVLKLGISTCSVVLDVTSFTRRLDGMAKISLGDFINNQTDIKTVKVNLSTTIDNDLEPKKKRRKTNSDFLSVLMCHQCQKYALPPIYENSDKKIVCSHCKPNILTTSNICLNNLANLVDYPCQFQDKGCSFLDKPPQIKEHQATCNYRPIKCPGCKAGNDQVNLNDFAAHLRFYHNNVERTNTTKCIKFDKVSDRYGFITYNDCVFLTDFGITTDTFYCTVEAIESQHIGNFYYEIEIVDENSPNRKITLRNLCGRLLNDSERCESTYLSLNKDLVQKFICSNNMLNLIFRVFPV